jgi:polysaccharide export outer membrane protein
MSNVPTSHLTIRLLLAACVLATLITSCTPRHKFVYLNDIRNEDTLLGPVRPFKETIIEPDDQLSVQVSAYNPADVEMFNMLQTGAGGGMGGAGGGGGAMGAGGAGGGMVGVPTTIGYLVDKRGMITIPYLGEFLAAGLTIREMEIYLAKQLERFVKQPIVKVRFLNHFVSIVGDAGGGKINMPNERLTMFDLLAATGDLRTTAYRMNILVIREDKGYRITGRVNLLSKNVFDNPFFYLQNKDMVYVEPVQASYVTSRDIYTRLINIGATFFTIALSLLTLMNR